MSSDLDLDAVLNELDLMLEGKTEKGSDSPPIKLKPKPTLLQKPKPPPKSIESPEIKENAPEPDPEGIDTSSPSKGGIAALRSKLFEQSATQRHGFSYTGSPAVPPNSPSLFSHRPPSLNQSPQLSPAMNQSPQYSPRLNQSPQDSPRINQPLPLFPTSHQPTSQIRPTPTNEQRSLPSSPRFNHSKPPVTKHSPHQSPVLSQSPQQPLYTSKVPPGKRVSSYRSDSDVYDEIPEEYRSISIRNSGTNQNTSPEINKRISNRSSENYYDEVDHSKNTDKRNSFYKSTPVRASYEYVPTEQYIYTSEDYAEVPYDSPEMINDYAEVDCYSSPADASWKAKSSPPPLPKKGLKQHPPGGIQVMPRPPPSEPKVPEQQKEDEYAEPQPQTFVKRSNNLGITIEKQSSQLSSRTLNQYAFKQPLTRSQSTAPVLLPSQLASKAYQSKDYATTHGLPPGMEEADDQNIYDCDYEVAEDKPRNNLMHMKRSESMFERRASEGTIETIRDKRLFLQNEAKKMSMQSTHRKCILNVYNKDDSYKTITVDEAMTAREVCELLIIKNHVNHSINWQLTESLVEESLEREIEDHEYIFHIHQKWPLEKNYRFIFQQNFKKYEIFQNPSLYNFAKPGEEKKQDKMDRAQMAKDQLISEMMMESDKIAEISGHLWVKTPECKWRNLFCFLRQSGLYYSTRANKDPKHHYILINFTTIDIYTPIDTLLAQETYKAPTSELMVFLDIENKPKVKETICICAKDRANKLCWQQGIRLSKYGVQDLRHSYQKSLRCHEKVRQITRERDTPSPKPSKPAFDFGHNTMMAKLSEEVWFHGELSKDAAADTVVTYGNGEGSYLLRYFDKSIFLCMQSGRKLYHIKLESVPLAGQTMFTIEPGLKYFKDCSDLIDHYSNEPGSLPCILGEPVAKMDQ